MKKTGLVSILLIVFAVCSFAETHISGTIEKSQNWNVKNSPYIISDSVIIEKKGFVTIDPGTVIKFKKDGLITVRGALYAKGSPKNPVRFLPFDGESFYEGIRFEGKYKNIIEFSIMIRGQITVEGGKLILSNNYILNSTGVLVYHFGKVVIKDNYFYNNTYGVYNEGNQTKVNILKNTFNNNRFGVYLKDLKKAQVKIIENNFMKNTVNLTNYTANDYECKNNYWGFYDERKVEMKLYDKKNNKKVGKLIYKPFKSKKFKLFTPTTGFKALVKFYLKLKRPDEHSPRVCIGGGLLGFMPFSPDLVKSEADMGLGMSAEFAISVANPILVGVEGKMFSLISEHDDYNYRLDVTNLFVNVYGYMGWSKRVFFVPYAKLSNGVAIISEQYKAAEPIYKNGTSNSLKNNEINYAVSAGLGVELFVLRFASVKVDANYCYTLKTGGNLSYAYVNATANIYFEIPFLLSAN